MGIDNPVHLIFLGAIALMVLGPKRLPEVARSLGKGIREFRESMERMSGGLGEDHQGPPPPAEPLPLAAASVPQSAFGAQPQVPQAMPQAEPGMPWAEPGMPWAEPAMPWAEPAMPQAAPQAISQSTVWVEDPPTHATSTAAPATQPVGAEDTRVFPIEDASVVGDDPTGPDDA